MKIYVLLFAALIVSAGASAQKKTHKHKKHIVKKETLVISPSGEKTTIEVSKKGVYVDGRLVATQEDLNNKNLKKKIIIGEGGGHTGNGKGMLGVHARDNAETQRGWEGAYLTDVNDGSAAEEAGLQRGDVILEIDDERINGAADLTKTVRKHAPGQEVTITYLRDEEKHTARARLDAFQLTGTLRLFDDNGENGTDFEMSMPPGFDEDVMDNTMPNVFMPGMKPKLGVTVEDNDEGTGAVVTGVRKGSLAEQHDIRDGDVISQVDNENISGAKDLQETIQSKRPGSSIKLEVKRGTLRMYKNIKLNKEKSKRDM